MEWDVFISHASEDKAVFVRSLAEALRAAGLRVWYDEHALKLGDSIRRGIERGLASSQFGVVILSPAFLQKEWPQKELDYFVTSETSDTRRILPVWHNVDATEVRTRFPLLADRVAVNTINGLDSVVSSIRAAIDASKAGPDSADSSGIASSYKPEQLRELSEALYSQLVSEPTLENVQLHSVRVLAVEDDISMLKLYSVIFKEFGAKVYLATDGVEAMRLLEEHVVDIVVADIMMPRMTGVELLAHIEKNHPTIPIVFSSAWYSPDEVEKLSHAAFIHKPLLIDDLAVVVWDIVRKDGLYSCVKQLCSDNAAAYRVLTDCRRTVCMFLERYWSDNLFETALRHKIKDTIRRFCKELHHGQRGVEQAKQLSETLGRLNSLMGQILHGSKAGLRKILLGIEEDVRSERPGLLISTSKVPRLPSSVSGSEVETFLAFCALEFVANAVDAIEGCGEIRVAIRNKRTRSALYLSVWNNGPRISEELLPKLFDEGVSTKGRGRGMGLHIIQRIGDRFCANVALTQEDGVQFSVEVPVDSDAT